MAGRTGDLLVEGTGHCCPLGWFRKPTPILPRCIGLRTCVEVLFTQSEMQTAITLAVRRVRRAGRPGDGVVDVGGHGGLVAARGRGPSDPASAPTRPRWSTGGNGPLGRRRAAARSGPWRPALISSASNGAGTIGPPTIPRHAANAAAAARRLRQRPKPLPVRHSDPGAPQGDADPGRKRNLLASMMRHRFRSALPVLPPRVMRSPHAQISRICGRFSVG